MNLNDSIRRFCGMYDQTMPEITRAPGRVNLIGEHTDYNLGLVLPMAIDLECYVFAAPSGDDMFRVHSEQFAGSLEWPLKDASSLKPRGDWSDRVAGVIWVLARRQPLVAQNLLIDSMVPLGGGLSSSAALGVALTLALGGERPGLELAQLARAAEVEFVGVPCGIMDQFVAVHGQAGAAILLDCRTLDWRPVKIPEDVAIVVTNSMVKHELGNSAYSTRVAECNAAARALGVQSLRDARLDQVDSLDPVLRKRARHVISENARVERFAAAAAVTDVACMGKLMTDSHASLRDDYEVSCEELDFLVENALHIPGVLGSRMTGGGFGGSTVTLVRQEAVDHFRKTVVSEYERWRGLTPQVHVAVPSPGAARLSLTVTT